MDLYAIPHALRDIVDREIKPPEAIRWAAQPEPGDGLPPHAYGAAFVGGCQVVIVSTILISEAERMDGFPWFQAVLLVPLIAVGGGLLACPSWMRRRLCHAAQNTLYVITDRRAVVFNGGFHGTRDLRSFLAIMFRLRFGELRTIDIRSFGPEELRYARSVRHPDGTEGVLFFESMPEAFEMETAASGLHGFHSVVDAAGAERLLRELAARGTTQSD